jgi:hypothetical protein
MSKKNSNGKTQNCNDACSLDDYPTITINDYSELAKGTLRESQKEFLAILQHTNVFVVKTGTTHYVKDVNDLAGWLEFNKAVFSVINQVE